MTRQCHSGRALPHNLKTRRSAIAHSLLCLSAMSAAGTLPSPAHAQQGEARVLEELVVTARRREELMQDVPISMTVFTQQQISDANITNAADLATYTPSLQTNNRFGQDATVFQIRGFTQELRTTSSVGVYFAEVVAPRGANTSNSGDGAGPGDFFDLENVQVLKGPQGTLFGRNTTGGAVMLTPKKPTDEFEGYVEGSAGNYDMLRGQAVVNVPVSDRVRLRFGIDDHHRDGHLNNVSGVGPEDLADVDYTSLRASAVIDITGSLENYTILRTLDSSNNNMTTSVFACNPAAPPSLDGIFGRVCEADLANRAAVGGDGFYDVWNSMPKPRSEIDQWQGINTTTWQVSDNFLVKNILSYAELKTRYEAMVFGTNLQFPITNGGSQELVFGMGGLAEGASQVDSSTVVEEFQLQGDAFEERLTWQAGLYYEKTEPEGDYGSQNVSLNSCDWSTTRDPDPLNWRCNSVLAGYVKQRFGLPQSAPLYVGSMNSAPGGVEYENKAVFAQASYQLSEQWSVTAGIRYTDDETKGYVEDTIAQFPSDLINGGYFPADMIDTYIRQPETSSDEPTWLLGLDYKPTEDTLLYGKYSRGYRQGSVNLAGTPPLDVHGPEQVDAYELGAKATFDGQFPATLAVATFYNDFQDQQVQFGYRNVYGQGTTAIINAGASTIWGAELEATVLLTDDLRLSASYAYLDTKVDELVLPVIPPSVGDASTISVTTAEGEPLPYAPENQLVLAASYMVPVDEALGDVTLVATYVYSDDMQGVASDKSPLAVLPSYDLFNFNLNWIGIAGSPVDASLFVTNLFDEEYRTYISGTWNQGFEVGQVGLPRMYGARLKYNF